ncbi:histidine phosphatase family protein [Halobacillus salinus]|uniref:histidine phosphatase family protein n=1 Tax=Halobacillus salinus TaxID=192814 RepID=UPI0009A8C624|nr:histidine phosphatase family protein [Halobacillus salinus]
MSTFIYMVRHGESPKEGNERTRGLTEQGSKDADLVAATLKTEAIDVVVSSPYKRPVMTVEKTAQQFHLEVLVREDLRERKFVSDETRIPDRELAPILEKSFEDPDFSVDGGESNAECQRRAVDVLMELLDTFQGGKVVVGTHGAVMTLMMGYFDEKYDLEFLYSTTKPDIYRMEFHEKKLIDVQRLWIGETP